MKKGDKVITYYDFKNGFERTRIAELLAEEREPDFSKLFIPGDLEREFTAATTEYRKWEVHFLGDPDNHTYSRWIHPKQLLERQPTMRWILITTLFSSGRDHWANKQIGKYINSKCQLRITVEQMHFDSDGNHIGNNVIMAKIFENEIALDKWLKDISDMFDFIPDNKLSICAIIQKMCSEDFNGKVNEKISN